MCGERTVDGCRNEPDALSIPTNVGVGILTKHDEANMDLGGSANHII